MTVQLKSGQTVNLSSLSQHYVHPTEAVRRRAERRAINALRANDLNALAHAFRTR